MEMAQKRLPLVINTTRRRGRTADDGEALGEPVSPSARLVEHFHIVVVIGLAAPVDRAAVRQGIEDRIACYPRFRSIQVEGEDGAPRWARTSTLSMDDHILYPRLDAASVATDPDRAVEDYVASLSTLPMDRSRPSWEFHVLDFPTSEATATAVMRVHHSLADGMSLLTLLMASTRSAAEPARLPAMLPPPRRHGAIYGRPRPPASAGTLALAVWLWSLGVLVWHTLVDAARLVAMILFSKDSDTLFKQTNCGRKRIVHRSLSLDDVKFIKDAINCTVNDVLIGVSNAALSRYYFRKSGDNSTNKEIRLRSLLTVDLRPPTSLQACVEMIESGKGSDVKWGNQVGFIILPFHISMHLDPLNYVRKAKKILDRKKGSLEVVFTHVVAQVALKVFGLKAAGTIFHHMVSHTTIAFSNMVGPIEHVEFCGHPVTFIASSGYGPTETLGVYYQSYVNTIMVSLAVDDAEFPGCHELLDDFTESLRDIKDAARSIRNLAPRRD